MLIKTATRYRMQHHTKDSPMSALGRQLPMKVRPLVFIAGLGTAIVVNALLASWGSNWKLFLAAMIFSAFFAIPSAILIGIPVFLATVRLKMGRHVACVVGGAAAGFVGAMAITGFGFLDPLVIHGRIGEAVFAAARRALIPGVAGLVGGLVMAILSSSGWRGQQASLDTAGRELG